MAEYKQCPNGHYYQGDHCPYCKGGNAAGASKTQIYGMDAPASNETVAAGMPPVSQQPVYNQGPSAPASNGGQKTVIGGDAATVVGGGAGNSGYGQQPNSDGRTIVDYRQSQQTGNGSPTSGRTVFGDFDETGVMGGPGGKPVFRETRKFVGWLVSYTLDPLGVDFKLYEGRNIIGRDMDCNITINDNMVSSKHAVLLYRAGKYSLTDSQSSHGTFVNGNDIDLEPCYLADGDEIRIGQTMLKFRSSL
jgi:hypothetical protein